MAEVWFKEAQPSDALLQGDLILDLEVSVVTDSDQADSGDDGVERATVERYVTPAVILTQSCDLVDDGIQQPNEVVLLARATTLTRFRMQSKVSNNRTLRDADIDGLAQGLRPAFLMLDRLDASGITRPDIDAEYWVVDFSAPLVVDFVPLVAQVSALPRYHLTAPYREHVSQSYARYTMRVGLPLGLPSFRSRKWCTSCRRAVADSELLRPAGHVMCPFCGARSGQLLAWDVAKAAFGNAQWPGEKTALSGKQY